MAYEQFIPLFVEKFEVPKAPGPEDDRSLAFARELYAAVERAAPVAPAPPAAPTPSPSSSSSAPQPQAVTMEEALAALIPIIQPIIVPLAESLISGVVGGIIKQGPTLVPAILQALAEQNAPAKAAPTLEQIVAEALKQFQASMKPPA